MGALQNVNAIYLRNMIQMLKPYSKQIMQARQNTQSIRASRPNILRNLHGMSRMLNKKLP